MYITDHTSSAFNHKLNGEAEKAVSRVKLLIKKIAHAKGDLKGAFARLRDSPMANSKMSPARLMFRRILRFPGLPVLPVLPDNVGEVVAREEKQSRKVAGGHGQEELKGVKFWEKICETGGGIARAPPGRQDQAV